MNLHKTFFLLLLSFATLSFMHADENTAHEVLIEIKIKCPMSEELKAFVKSIPDPESQSVGLEEWKASFISNMTRLMDLVESKKMFDAHWSVKTDDQLPFLVKDAS